MVKFGWRKKSDAESLLPSKQKSGLFGKKAARSEDSTSPSKSLFSRKKYRGEEPPEYETPPPSPLYDGDGQPTSPLHVTVVATRPSPPGTPGRAGEDNSLSGTTISDLSGSILTSPTTKSPKKNNRESTQSESENEGNRCRTISPISQDTPVSDPSSQGVSFSQSTSPNDAENDIVSSCSPDAASDLVKNLMGLVENGCSLPEPPAPEEVKSFETPMVTNKEAYRPPTWGMAPTMSVDEDLGTQEKSSAQETQTTEHTDSRTGMWKYLEKTTDGSVCSKPPEESVIPTTQSCVDEKQDENTARNTLDTHSSDADRKTDNHENFELVLAETDDDRSTGSSTNSDRRARNWLNRKKTKPEKKPENLLVEKSQNAPTSWRRNATGKDGEEIPVNEFTIETDQDMSITSDMDKDEVYRAVFGMEDDEEAEAAQKTHIDKKRKTKKTRIPPPKPEVERKKKSSRGMFKAVSKRLSTRPKPGEKGKAVEEKPKAMEEKPKAMEQDPKPVEQKPKPVAKEETEVELETKAKNDEEDTQSFVQLTIDGLKEEELLGEELVEEEHDNGGKRRFSNFLQKSFKTTSKQKEERKVGQKQKIHAEVERAMSDESPSVSTNRSRSWSLTLPEKKVKDPLPLKRSNSLSSLKPSEKKDKSPVTEPKSLTRTYSNPFQKLTSNFSFKKKQPEKPPEPAPKPERPDWKAVTDAGTGKTYYYHRVTRQTTWTKPPDFDFQIAQYERSKRNLGVSVKPQKKSLFNRSSADMSAEQQKRMEDGVPLHPRKRSLTSVLRKKSSRDFNRDVWETKQEITKLLKSMGPTEVESAEDLMKRYEGNESELLVQLRALAESTPFDEPVKENAVGEEEKKEEGPAFAQVASRTRTALTTSTGASGLTGSSGFSSRVRSSRTALTSLTDTTQKIKNTQRNLSGFGTVPEEVTQQRDTSMATSMATSLSSEMEDAITKNPSHDKIVADRRLPFAETPIRDRALRVEEFESGRYNVKRAEVFEKNVVTNSRAHTPPSSKPNVKLIAQATRTVQPAIQPASNMQEPDESSSFLDEEDETDLDTYGTDSVSELGHSDAEFQRQKRRYDLARRMALDDAIKNRDWELAASVAENIRGRSFDSKASSVQTYHEWTQSELDKFISENDWDAVAGYIAFMRDNKSEEGNATGYSIPHMSDGKPPRKPRGEEKASKRRESETRHRESETRHRDPEPRRRESEPRRMEPDPRKREPESRSGPQKRFGARSQLQHDDSELVSIASSWDSVYRTDSSDDSFYSTSESSYDYRRRSRRMAT